MPDETDKPRDSFEPSSLEDELQAQLKAAVERSKNPVEEEWSPEEQAELNSELARIAFDPNHAHPDFADRTVVVGGEEVQIHVYNNFPMILSVVDMLRHTNETPDDLSFEAAYAAVANERKYLEIFEELEKTYPALYKRSKQIFARGGNPPVYEGLNINADEQTYVQSQAYSAAAHIAQAIDPEYNLDFLRK